MNQGAIILSGIVSTLQILGSLQAQEVAIEVQRAAVISFQSQDKTTYKLLGAESASGNWIPLKDGITEPVAKSPSSISPKQAKSFSSRSKSVTVPLARNHSYHSRGWMSLFVI
jgi:hypothetical protein